MFPFTKVFLNLFTAFSLFAHPHLITDHNLPSIISSPTISQTIAILKASVTISQFGKSVNIVADFPREGGNLTGEISGDCKGKITGTYSGDNNGRKLQGTGDAQCPLLFLNINGIANFNGTVNDTDTGAGVNYTIKANNQIQNGTFTFTISSE